MKYAAMALVAALLLALWRNDHLSGEVDQLSKTTATQSTELAGLREAATIYGQKVADANKVNKDAFDELEKAKADNESLRAAVDAGDKRLRLHATCPSPVQTEAAASHPSPGPLVDGAGPELTADARAAYFRLRDEITRSQKQIAGLQSYINSVCVGAPSTSQRP